MEHKTADFVTQNGRSTTTHETRTPLADQLSPRHARPIRLLFSSSSSPWLLVGPIMHNGSSWKGVERMWP